MSNKGNLRVITGDGRILGTGLTTSVADAMMKEFMSTAMAARTSVRSELESQAQDSSAVVQYAPPAPSRVGFFKAIEVGAEREELGTAISDRAKASDDLAKALSAVKRAQDLVACSERKVSAASENFSKAMGSTSAALADLLRNGDSTAAIAPQLDRGALVLAEIERDASHAALDQLVTEKEQAEAAFAQCQDRTLHVINVIKQREHDSLVIRLEELKAEYNRICALVEGAKYADIVLSPSASAALRPSEPNIANISAAQIPWLQFGRALEIDSHAEFAKDGGTQ